MNQRKKVILACAAAGATAAAAYTLLAPKVLMNAALDREEPAIIKNSTALFSHTKHSDDTVKRAGDADRELRKRTTERVEMISHDGIPLMAHWDPHPDAKRIIIAMHGWRSTWSRDFGMISGFWRENGCSILYAEQRGQNASGGDSIGFGILERYDCLDWIRWVTARCGDAVPIYLSGLSMGAATVLMASELDLPENVHGIIADCGYTSPEAIWKHVSTDNLHLPYVVCRPAVNSICRRRLRVGASDISTLNALAKATTPVLFIHGDADHFVPVEMTYENYRACASPKRLLIVPGADHAMSYVADRESYEKAVLDFWAAFDGRIPS